MRSIDHDLVSGQVKRPSFAESLGAASEGAGDMQHAFSDGVSAEPFRNYACWHLSKQVYFQPDYTHLNFGKVACTPASVEHELDTGSTSFLADI